jgi:hypothetical protein
MSLFTLLIIVKKVQKTGSGSENEKTVQDKRTALAG